MPRRCLAGRLGGKLHGAIYDRKLVEQRRRDIQQRAGERRRDEIRAQEIEQAKRDYRNAQNR